MTKYFPLTREEMRKVINGEAAAARVPMMIHFWTNPKVFGKYEDEIKQLLEKYPMDVRGIGIKMPAIYDAPADDPEYRWVNYDKPNDDKVVGIDENVAIKDWSQWEGILNNFPNPEYSGLLPQNPEEDGRYRLGLWYYWLFERHWSLRGMTNALTDFYEYPEKVHELYRALTDFYLRAIERGKNERNMDGIFVSDDIGTQTGPFFSKAIFEEFFKPYYKELIDKAHSLGMHFWLHSCGNIEAFLPDFIEIGLDVIHPIQKYSMDEKRIAEKYGNDICIWAGFDVQRVIPYGTPEEVRREVRFMIDTYYRTDGRFMLTAGNGITADCTVESFEALLNETNNYGTEKFNNNCTASIT
jgi:hypothetical protein